MMAIARGISEFLREHHIPYEVLWHKHADTGLRTASEAHLPARDVVKAVVLEAEGVLFMALVPASKMVDFEAIRDAIGVRAKLAAPSQFEQIFADCERGAVPATGPAYGFSTLLDEQLATASDLYFDAGDQEELIHVKGPAFRRALGPVLIGEFARNPVHEMTF
jgi:Ala-tRNA(Pro) deacylase